MERTYWSKQVLRANGLVAVLMLTQSGSALGQTVGGETRERAQKSEEKVNPAEVVALLRQLQYQVRELNAEVGTLKEQQQSAQTLRTIPQTASAPNCSATESEISDAHC